MSDFSGLSDWLQQVADCVDDDGRRKLTQRISQKAKRAMTQRIAAQTDPSAAKFVPRKRNHARANRRGPLFQRLTRQIKTSYDSNKAEVGFSGRTATVMKVHQYGQSVQPSPNARAVNYPVRETVGWSQADEAMIIDEIQIIFSDL